MNTALHCNVTKAAFGSFSKVFESFQRQIVSTVDTASAILTGAVYYDSHRNDPDFFSFTPVSDRKSEEVSTADQIILKAFRR